MREKGTNTVIKSAVIKNPVLFEAIGIAPVVAMATSLKTSIILTVITAVELLIIELVTCKFLKMLKSRFRVLVYAVLGVFINLPMLSLFSYFAPNETAKVSIFLPIIAVNSLIALHCERFAVKHSIRESLIDALSSSFGYGLIVMLTGLLREILGSGTVYGHDLSSKLSFSGLLLPFGGFLVLGYISAFFKIIIKKSYPDENPETAFNLSEISQSHFGNIKSLFDEDFNPFDEDVEDEALEVTDKKLSKREKAVKTPRIKLESMQKRDKSKKEKPLREKKSVSKNSKPESVSKDMPVEEKPSQEIENIVSDSKKYESEFDDLLSELEIHKNKNKDGEKQ